MPARLRGGRLVRTVAMLAVIGAILGATAAGLAAWIWWQAPVSTVGTLEFANPLRIPPLAGSTTDAAGRRVFRLATEAGTTEFREGQHTETWGINGTYLAPTLRAERGDRVIVHLTNRVDEATTLHWHGMHLPARADGGPHQLITPGDTWSPTWTVDQPAATLWFHPHPHEATAQHVKQGVAGMFLVDDPRSRGLDLPSSYGRDDIPLIIQDRSFDDEGQFSDREPVFSNVGLLGDEILVNGTHDPHLTVTTELVRLRVLNASNARLYNLRFDDGRAFALIGTDGGLLPAPTRMDQILLSPGDRAELVVAVEPGERTVLRSLRPDLGIGAFRGRFNGGADSFDLLQLRAAPSLEASAPLPERLVDVDPPDESAARRTRSFVLGNDVINDRSMDMRRIDEVVEVDTVEVWEVTNAHSRTHSFHPHLLQFAVLDVDGEPPPAALTGWQDTVYVPPGVTIRIVAKFEGHTDEHVPYMFHCHILEHEDDGMMGQFTVVDRP